jgi:hypothetical protein
MLLGGGGAPVSPGGARSASGIAGILKGFKGTNWGGLGMMLATSELLGANRATGLGIAGGAAGGAMVGFERGGTLGALIGGGAGLVIGGFEKAQSKYGGMCRLRCVTRKPGRC